jgi:hypothetical protein
MTNEYYFFNVEGRLLPIRPTKDILPKGSIDMDMFESLTPYPTDITHRLRVLHKAFTKHRLKWGVEI